MQHLTPKQRAFCHHYIETLGNAPEAALQAYNCSSRGSARVMAHRCLHNPYVLRLLADLARRDGLPERALHVLTDALEATRTVNGRLTVPDHATRLRAALFVINAASGNVR
ncbi:MAG: terminase small subunit [Acidobacteriota bacterium]